MVPDMAFDEVAGVFLPLDIETEAAAERPDPKTPVNISHDEMCNIVKAVSVDGENYRRWIDMGLAIYHQTRGSLEGQAVWIAWAEQHPDFKLEDALYKWSTFKPKADRKPEQTITFRSVIRWAQEAGYNGSGARRFSDTDIANGRRIVEHFGDVMRYSDAANWSVYDGVRWVQSEHLATANAKRAIEKIADEVSSSNSQEENERLIKWAKRSQDRARLGAALQLAQSEAGMLRAYADYDTDPDLFLVQNGTLHLPTGKLQPFSRDDFCMRIAGTDYVEDGTCDLWEQFLQQIMRDEEMIAYLKRAIGYLLSGHTGEQVLFFLFGRGANGKSVLLEAIKKLMGEYAVATPATTLMENRGSIPNDVARLTGTRLVAVNETQEGARFHEGLIKDLTGDDTIAARFLHKEFFEFKPRFKLCLRGNHKPRITGTDDGIWRRIHLIPFQVQIPEAERDPNLLNKLLKELPGILNWALAGFQEWRKEGLKPPRRVVEAGQERANGHEKVSSVCFADQMELHGVSKKRKGDGSYWLGIRVTEAGLEGFHGGSP